MKVEGRFDLTAHKFAAIKGIPWPVCTKCGLVLLRNEFTDFCVRHGCNHESHPFYKRALHAIPKNEQ